MILFDQIYSNKESSKWNPIAIVEINFRKDVCIIPFNINQYLQFTDMNSL